MVINKITKQKMEVVKKNQPDLFTSINAFLPNLSDEEKGAAAGLIIEYIIRSGGDAGIFEEETIEGLEAESEETLHL